MKKILQSRWFPLLVGVFLFLCTIVGLTIMAKNSILKDGEIKELKDKLAAQQAQIAEVDQNATQAKQDTMMNAAESEDKVEHEDEIEKTESTIRNSFEIIHEMSAPGELQFDNRALPPLIEALERKRAYLEQRSTKLYELEAHMREQLEELHFHTNRIMRSQEELDKLLESRVTFIKEQEVAKLKNLAAIYESRMTPDQPEPGAAIRAWLKANQTVDPALNAKLFQYIAPTNQATILNELLTGEQADVPLYQDIIKSLMKTMPAPSTTQTP